MSGKKALIMAVLLVAVVALMAGCAGQSKTAKAGDTVSVDYTGRYDNGTIFDTSNATLAQEAGIYSPTSYYEPITFTIGNEEVIPGFENAVVGMKVGETKNFTLSPSEAYGEYDPTAFESYNMSDFVEANMTPYVNQTLYGIYYWPVRIDSINVNDSDYNRSIVSIDYNHPMAGKTLHFWITLRSIETATPTPKP
jgi:peptidylprolyl isomerase